MAPRKSPKSGSPGPGPRREAKHGGNKNGKKEGISGSSFFTWFMVIALLGVWTSVAVVWFELVDYEEVLGKLGIYDADGDGDFDVEDAKVLLGLKERSVQEQPILKDTEEVIQPAKERYTRAEHTSPDEVEPEDEIQSLLREVLESQLVKEQAGDADEENILETNLEEDVERNEIPEAPTLEEDYDGEVQEAHESFQEDHASDYQPEEPETDDAHATYEYHAHVEEDTYQPESPDDTELNLEDALEHNTDDTELNLEDALDHATDLENEDIIEVHDTDEEPFTEYHHEDIKGEPIDRTEHKHEHETEDPNSFTEHIESEDEREHTEDHGATQPHETDT